MNGNNTASYITGWESASSSPPRVDFSLNYTPRHPAMAEMSAHSGASSMDQTSSTAVRETDVQFLNDSIAVGAKTLMPRTRRARMHRVDVTVPADTRRDRTSSRDRHITVPNDTRNDTASSRAHKKSTVTFQDFEPVASSVVSSTNGGLASAVINDIRPNDNVLPCADRGELTI